MKTDREALKQARDALALAKSSHGLTLTSHPAQEAWQAYRVEDKINAALAAADARLAEPQGEPAAGGNVLLDGMKYHLPPLVISGAQLLEALDFVAPDRTEEQMECEVCLAVRDKGPDVDGEPSPAGMCCWLDEYPEEGALHLPGAYASPPSREWVSVEERLPVVPEGERFITVCVLDKDCGVRIREWRPDSAFGLFTTHWMPLPSPPTDTEKD